MGNGKSNLIQTGSTVSTRLFRSAKDDNEEITKERSQFPENQIDDVSVDEKLRKAWENKQRQNSRNRRRSVSVHVRSIRRQSSLLHENLVKINLLRKVRDVYAGLDSSGNQLGEGTWGQVFLVHRRDDPSKKAAIKILQLSETLENARLNELRSEISLLQKIDHPHIAKLYETFEDDGLNLYLVMEYLAGGELFDRVIEQGHFSEPAAATAIKQMVGAIQYLHSRGIVHRDLKLENWVYRDKDGDQLVLIDFGLSCRYFDETNSEGHDFEAETRNNRLSKNKLVKKYMREMVGSSYYMAPEVLKRKYGKECDLWSIGVIAYMLLSGHPPFAGDTDAQILRKVKTGQYDFNHSAFSKVTENSKDFVSKLLVYNPADRMTAKDALKHVWLSDHHKKMMQRRSKRRGSVIDKAVVDNLKNFVNTNRFKKLALQAVAYSTGYDDIKDLQQIFEDIDQDQDGYISFQELQEALKDNPNVDPKYVAKIFEAMDVNKMQKIHLNEFIAATMNHSLTKDENLLHEAFNRLDMNETGEISKADLTELLGKNFDKQTIDQIFREFSADIRKSKSEKSKGEKFKTLTKVTKKDFIKAMRRARIQNTQSLLSLPSDDSEHLLEEEEQDKESVEETFEI